MATFQQILNQAALILGGTQPDPVADPYWFSGNTVGDNTQIAGLKGAWSVPPAVISDTPSAIVMPGPFSITGPERSDVLITSAEWNIDELRLMLAVSLNDTQLAWANLIPYRDSVPAAFRKHLGLFGTINVQAWIHDGKPITFTYGSNQYVGWEFTIRCLQLTNPVYTA